MQEYRTSEVLKMPRVKKNSYEGYNSAFASRLRYLMSHSDANQQKLADFIGVTRQAVSAYTLGVSLPDIEKFEKIADFFGVSTEYLLGRTDVMAVDIEKQAIAKALQLNEETIDRIIGLQKKYHSGNSGKKPLAVIFDRWLRFTDLEELMDNIFRSTQAASYTQLRAYNMPNINLDEKAVNVLKQQGCEILPPAGQMDLYEQKATKIFIRSVEQLQEEAKQATIDFSEIEGEDADQPENNAD
jgi:transcriptional regulator with XRE-family HTH domain